MSKNKVVYFCLWYINIIVCIALIEFAKRDIAKVYIESTIVLFFVIGSAIVFEGIEQD